VYVCEFLLTFTTADVSAVSRSLFSRKTVGEKRLAATSATLADEGFSSSFLVHLSHELSLYPYEAATVISLPARDGCGNDGNYSVLPPSDLRIVVVVVVVVFVVGRRFMPSSLDGGSRETEENERGRRRRGRARATRATLLQYVSSLLHRPHTYRRMRERNGRGERKERSQGKSFLDGTFR